MKRVLFTIILFLSFSISVNALTGYVYCPDDNNPINVREGESTSSKILGAVKCNSTVTILNENTGSNWYQIQQGNLIGYSSKDYIRINKTSTNLKGRVSCIENNDPLTVRDSVNGNVDTRLPCDTEMKILDDTLGSAGYCSNWYKVSYGDNKIGYVCGTYVITEVDVDLDGDEAVNYRNSLKSAGFPDSYLDDLVKLHFEHPTWQFVPFNTNLDWNTVIENESVAGRNLVWYSYGEGYRSKESYSYNYATDEYYRHSKEINWWYASPEAIAYYMDPRNYLNSKNIFTFESLSYESSFQTSGIVDKILGNSFMPNLYKKYSSNPYTDAFIEAAGTYNVSPIHLASRVLQEQGINGSSTGLGTYKGYENIFNFYNIKAVGNDPSVALLWAKGGVDGTLTSYGRPWDSPYKSIIGGAKFLSEDYISIGQNTLYFEKFDVSRSNGHYTHQYMQNLTAPLTEGVTTYSSYSSINGLLDEALVFIIPVYNNMPSTKVEVPANNNPNSYLKSIKVNDKELDGFAYDKLNYSMEADAGVDSIKIEATSINNKASIEGLGTVKLENGDNKITIKVTAENGNVTNYVLVINKKEKEENIDVPEDNTITNIVIDNTDLVFDKDTLKYDIETSFENSKLSIKYYIGNDINTKEIDLIVGKNIVNIGKYTINITRNDIAIGTALNNSGIKYNDSYVYGISLNTGTDSLINNIKKISDTLSISIKDSNGNNSSIFKTGDKVNIKSSLEEKNYEVLIYGDVNGDGVIDKLDYLAILRHYYGYKKYDGVYKEAADVNKDGTIDKLDYLAVLRDYYGYKKIVQ